jgi:hypothetical protein
MGTRKEEEVVKIRMVLEIKGTVYFVMDRLCIIESLVINKQCTISSFVMNRLCTGYLRKY